MYLQIALLHFAQIQKMGVWSSQGNKKLFTLSSKIGWVRTAGDHTLPAARTSPDCRAAHSLTEPETGRWISHMGRRKGMLRHLLMTTPEVDNPFGQGA